MRVSPTPVIVLLAASLIGCYGSEGKSEKSTVTGVTVDSLTVEELPMPVPPDSLPDGKAKIAFILEHFWDSLDFKNDRRVFNQAFLEQNFSNFIAIMPYATHEARQVAVGRVVERAALSPRALTALADVADLYLYEPNSPFYDEDSYRYFLEEFVKTEGFDAARAERFDYQLEAVNKNRPGLPGADFGFVTREGSSMSLRSMPVSGLLLVVFYDPDCDNCKKIMARLSGDPTVAQMTADRRLTVLAVYSGEKKALWKEGAAKLPPDWTVGYEPGNIEEEELYEFRASPTLYLLDKDKRVLAKDVRMEMLPSLLDELTSE